MDTKTIHLRQPIEYQSQTYSEVDLREPTAGELETAARQHNAVGSAICLIALIAKIPEKAVRKMSNRDLAECSNFLGSFNDPDDSPLGTGDESESSND